MEMFRDFVNRLAKGFCRKIGENDIARSHNNTWENLRVQNNLGDSFGSGSMLGMNSDGQRGIFIEPNRKTRAAVSPPSILTVEEKLSVTLKRDGGICSFDMQGTLWLQIFKAEDGYVLVQVETGGNSNTDFQIHPCINKQLFDKYNILAYKRILEPFPIGEGENGFALLSWGMQRPAESMVTPLPIHFLPSVSGDETCIIIRYEALPMFDLTDVIISVPLPALRAAPRLISCDGHSRYCSRMSLLEWSILRIDDNNRSGLIEFVVPQVDSSVFFPISVKFATTRTFSGLMVSGLINLRGGPTPKFVQKTQMIAQDYRVVV